MPDDIKRMRYYNGLFLQEEEFQLEQEYNIRQRRIHNARLHSKGIVWGLDVKLGTVADTVIVEEGMALDYYHEENDSEYQGREMIVTEERPVDLSPFAANDVIYIWIRYDELPAGDDSERGDEPFNIIESYQIETSTTRPIDEDLNIILAVVTVNIDGTIDENSISFEDPANPPDTIRISAGFSGGRVETDRLTLVAENVAGPYGYMVGTQFAPGTDPSRNGISVFSPQTDLKGDVLVEGDETVQGEMTVQQGARVNGDLQVDGALAGRVPLGGVMPVFDYGANIPGTSNDITPDGFMLADGQPLPATTALHAMATAATRPTDRPDLSNDVFIMGATSSGTTGGSNSVTVTIPPHKHTDIRLDIFGQDQDITISGTTLGQSNDHGHSYNTYVGGGPLGSLVALPNGNFVQAFTGGFTQNHTHALDTTAELGLLGITGEVGPDTAQNGDVALTSDVSENRPSYVSAVYLIRVN